MSTKKRIFNLKHKTIAPFCEGQMIGHQKTHNDNWANKHIAWNTNFESAKMTLAQLITLTWLS